MVTNLRLSRISRSSRVFILVLGLACGAAFISSSDAFAGGYARHYHGRGHAYGRGHHHKYVAHRSFYVPHRIHGGYVSAYRPYYGGQFYFAPHHHIHTVYTFPAYYPTGAVVYRPHVYCGGGLVASPWLPPHGSWLSVAAGVPVGNGGYVTFQGNW
jgi:hypothetical protein